eukprot:197397_1
MKITQRLKLVHVIQNSRFTPLSRFRQYGNINLNRHFCSQQNKQPKEDKDANKDTDKPNDEKNNSGSIFSMIKDIFSWSAKAAETMAQNSENNKDDKNIQSKKDTNNEWISMWEDIKQSNEFQLNADPKQGDLFNNEWGSFQQISRTEFMHRTMMKINYYPLKYEEFMVGAHQGIEFIFECLEQNDLERINEVVTKECMDKMIELKDQILDEKYNKVGKIMAYIKDVRNNPNFKDNSIDGRYIVRYYYQLKCENEAVEEGVEEGKEKENNDEYIQKRCDVIWQSKWLPVKGWTYKISDDGWKVEGIECADIVKS